VYVCRIFVALTITIPRPMPTLITIRQNLTSSAKYLLATLLFTTTLSDTLGQTAPDTTNHKDITVDTTISPAARWYAKETIYLVGGNTYVKDGKQLMGRKALLHEFSVSPSGMKLYVRSRRIRNITMTVSIAGAVGTIISTTSKNRDNLRGLMWTSIGVGIVSSWGTAYANSMRDRAFWTRNYDVMLKMNEEK
jgi:hypothetical protein